MTTRRNNMFYYRGASAELYKIRGNYGWYRQNLFKEL